MGRKPAAVRRRSSSHSSTSVAAKNKNDAEKKSQEDVATGKTASKKRFSFQFGLVLTHVCIVFLALGFFANDVEGRAAGGRHEAEATANANYSPTPPASSVMRPRTDGDDDDDNEVNDSLKDADCFQQTTAAVATVETDDPLWQQSTAAVTAPAAAPWIISANPLNAEEDRHGRRRSPPPPAKRHPCTNHKCVKGTGCLATTDGSGYVCLCLHNHLVVKEPGKLCPSNDEEGSLTSAVAELRRSSPRRHSSRPAVSFTTSTTTNPSPSVIVTKAAHQQKEAELEVEVKMNGHIITLPAMARDLVVIASSVIVLFLFFVMKIFYALIFHYYYQSPSAVAAGTTGYLVQFPAAAAAVASTAGHQSPTADGDIKV